MKKSILICLMTIAGYGICAAQKTDEVKVKKLAETSSSWDGTPLPSYPEGQPQITVLCYTFPAHKILDTHYHTIISSGVVLEGELTIVAKDGKEKTFRTGEALVETIGTLHYGENRGDIPTKVIVFYAGKQGVPLSIKSK